MHVILQTNMVKKVAGGDKTAQPDNPEFSGCLIGLKKTAQWIHLSLTQHVSTSNMTGQEAMVFMPINDIFIDQGE